MLKRSRSDSFISGLWVDFWQDSGTLRPPIHELDTPNTSGYDIFSLDGKYFPWNFFVVFKINSARAETHENQVYVVVWLLSGGGILYRCLNLGILSNISETYFWFFYRVRKSKGRYNLYPMVGSEHNILLIFDPPPRAELVKKNVEISTETYLSRRKNFPKVSSSFKGRAQTTRQKYFLG